MRTITIVQWLLVAVLVVLAYFVFNSIPTRGAVLRPPVQVYIYNLHPSRDPEAELIGVGEPFIREIRIHLHCPEEINGGGYRNGKFTYIYQGRR